MGNGLKDHLRVDCGGTTVKCCRMWQITSKTLHRIPPNCHPFHTNCRKDFTITGFGAIKGGDSSAAINKAIAACHDRGGGGEVIPAGSWIHRAT